MAQKKNDRLSVPAILLLLALAVGLGTYYRLLALDARPMHTDEAILAVKLGDLWTGKGFEYDPTDYHGPGLHYVAWAYGKLAGWGAPAEWTEAALRHVPALCGIGVMLCSLLLVSALSARAALVSMLLIAVSPMMVYYSRYFIMEMLLVLLVAISLCAWWRWMVTKNRFWLVVCGASLGFQHATKETFILNLAAAAGAWMVASFLIEDRSPARSRGSAASRRGPWVKPWQVLFLSAIVVSVTAYSAFFHDWQAVKESFNTYTHYFKRSAGSGHEKPWHYYLTLIFWRKDGLIWTEALIGGLGLVGILHSFFGTHKDGKKQRFLVFLSLYTLALFTGYSILSYKTPWSILTAQHALTLLAGVGGAALWGLFNQGLSNLVFQVAIGFGVYHLCDESMLAIGPYKADPRNPYAYAHTSTNLLQLVQHVREISLAHPESPPNIQVISRDQGWPLPWYFRGLPQVGYQAAPPFDSRADIIIAEAAQRDAVMLRVKTADYQDTGLHGLRPGVPLIMLVKKQLWAEHMARRQGLPVPEPKPASKTELPPIEVRPAFPESLLEFGPPAPESSALDFGPPPP